MSGVSNALVCTIINRLRNLTNTACLAYQTPWYVLSSTVFVILPILRVWRIKRLAMYYHQPSLYSYQYCGSGVSNALLCTIINRLRNLTNTVCLAYQTPCYVLSSTVFVLLPILRVWRIKRLGMYYHQPSSYSYQYCVSGVSNALLCTIINRLRTLTNTAYLAYQTPRYVLS